MRTICGARVFSRACAFGVPEIVGQTICVDSVVLTVPVTVAASTLSVAVEAAAAGCVIDHDAAMLATSVKTATTMGRRPRPFERGLSTSIRWLNAQAGATLRDETACTSWVPWY
jgi:hypothetical protein